MCTGPSDYPEHHISTSFLASGAPQVISQNKRLSGTCWTGSASYLSPVTDGKQSTFLWYNQSGSSDPHYEIHSQEKENVYSTCRVADLESPLSCLIYYVYKILLDSWFLSSSCSVSLIKKSHCSRMSLVMSFAKGLDGCSPNSGTRMVALGHQVQACLGPQKTKHLMWICLHLTSYE